MEAHEVIVSPRVETYRGKESRYVAIAAWRDSARKIANRRKADSVTVRAEGSAVDLNADLVNDFRVFYKPQATRIQNLGTEAAPVWRNADTRDLVDVGAILAKGGIVPAGNYVTENYTRDIESEINEAIERYKARAARKPIVYWGDKRGTTLNLQVSANADDASEDGSGTGFSSSWPTNYIYEHTVVSSTKNSGMRFQSVTVPAGATIDSADWQGYTKSGTNDPYFQLHAEDVDDSDDFLTTGDVNDRVRTTAFTLVDETNLAIGWHTEDVTTAVAEVIARPGWASGNALTLLSTSPLTQSLRWWDVEAHNGNSGNAPKLDIDYTEGGGGGGSLPKITDRMGCGATLGPGRMGLGHSSGGSNRIA